MGRSKGQPQLPTEDKVRVVPAVLAGELTVAAVARRHGVADGDHEVAGPVHRVGVKADVLYRDLDVVEHWAAEAEQCFEVDDVLGHLAGSRPTRSSANSRSGFTSRAAPCPGRRSRTSCG